MCVGVGGGGDGCMDRSMMHIYIRTNISVRKVITW